MFNSVQTYTTLQLTKRVYCAAPSQVTALGARTFGTWSFLSSIVRLYGAYHISNPQIYQLVLLTYVIVFAHFVSEWTVFRTTAWGAGLAGPILISTGSLVWMLSCWDFYVR